MKKIYLLLTSIFLVFFLQKAHSAESFCYKAYGGDEKWLHLSGGTAPQDLQVLRRIFSEANNENEGLCKKFPLNLNYSKNEELIFKEKQLFGTFSNSIYTFKKPLYNFQCNSNNQSIFSPNAVQVSCQLVISDEKNNFLKTEGENNIISPFTIVNGKLFQDLTEIIPPGGSDPLYCAILVKTKGNINYEDKYVLKKEPLNFMGKEMLNGTKVTLMADAAKNLGFSNSTFTTEYILAGITTKTGENISQALLQSLEKCFGQK